ncbi:L-lysine 6-monooxygenase (NADPH-requiring)-domain-containing protein [Lophiotrema nucula]|uniref:L-ornithine N(5)-monooxygenase [NAD(P)H] n=1 Tax=Lophiotrema nucula TaxID=690887 RepID=A0A6A5YUC0_9PLEO|nr:L-lysine 6-monooxygenase (NADPH-requiring)-domain-containing protein [Lophiotrema nucula]
MASAELNERPTTPTSNASPSYDLVCIGFGPAQIATAIALREAKQPNNALFLERKQSFSWHSTSVPRSRMNIPFANDLATPRNPKSDFTYVNYLLAKGRLVEFANSDRLQPLRIEFEEYLRWCAEHFKDQVQYGHEVVAIAPERTPEGVRGWNVAVKGETGQTYIVRAKKILAPALSSSSTKSRRQPQLFNIDFEAGQRIVSFDQYLDRRDEIREPRKERLDIALVGNGQRMLEVLDDLLSCHRLGNITVVTENEALAPVRSLGHSESPSNPRLCEIWKRPSNESRSDIQDAPELVQRIYSRAYDKQLQTKGRYTLSVRSSDASLPRSHLIVAENNGTAALGHAGNELFGDVNTLVLGCREKGESLQEVQFKRNTVAPGCRIWLISAKSEGGRSLAKDLAIRAGEVVRALGVRLDARQDQMVINARM